MARKLHLVKINALREYALIQTILFDLDGVLADFRTAAFKVHGVEYCEQTSSHTQGAMWDDIGISKNQFWAPLDADFWASLPLYNYARDLLGVAAHLVGYRNVFIATAASSPAACAGKIRWIRRELPSWLSDQYVLTTHKRLLSADTVLLVDDLPTNLVNFKHGVLVPRPWNGHRSDNVYVDICTQLYAKMAITNKE